MSRAIRNYMVEKTTDLSPDIEDKSHLNGRSSPEARSDDRDNYNYSISFLRFIMVFEVILCHYWKVQDAEVLPFYLKPFFKMQMCAVPVFMVMSFYYLALKIQKGPKNGLIFHRLYRLLFPYVIWAIVYYLIFGILENALSGFFAGQVLIKDLGWQLLLGSSRYLCPQFWYMADLIILTVIVCVLYTRMNSRNSLFVVFLLAMAAIWCQYSGINYKLFGGLPYESRYTLGRLSEMMPLAFAGLLLAKCNIDNTRTDSKCFIAVGCIAVLAFLYTFNVFSGTEHSFSYSGLYYVCFAVSTVLLCIQMPMSGIPRTVKKAVRFLGKYSFGVYCLHWAVGKYMMKIIAYHGYISGRFLQCLIVLCICYLLAYILSLLISLFPSRNLKYLIE